MAPRPVDSRRRLRLALLLVAAFGVAAVSGYLVTNLDGHAQLAAGPGTRPAVGAAALPAAGALVPAYDLSSDPVFPNLTVGYAIERHETSGGSSEELARSEDGGRTWHLVAPFPFTDGYSQVQFVSVSTGYAFGPAGVAVTHDGGASWTKGEALGGRLQRVVPIGANVWATYDVCAGPPEAATSCVVRLAISADGGLRWKPVPDASPLRESYTGGDVLARISLDAAYVVSYGTTGGALAFTADDGRSWAHRSDPCSAWPAVDLASPAPDLVWMICGGSPVLRGASAKAVFQSHDGGRTWVARAYTGFGPSGPGAGPLATKGPIGHLWFAGRLSQLATISPTVAWIGVSGVGVLVTRDGGADWSLVDGMSDHGASAGVGVTFNDARHGWAIEFRRSVWETSDAVRWTRVDGR